MQNFDDFPSIPVPPFSNSPSSITRQDYDINPTSSTSINTELLRYISDFDRAIRPRLKKYEEEHMALKTILEREKIIEDATRRLLVINVWVAILLPIVLGFSFVAFCFIYGPNSVTNFIEDSKFVISGGVAITLFALIKPLFFLHNMEKRLDAIEKKLKLNGNS